MDNKNTDELDNALESTHLDEFENFCADNEADMLGEIKAFSEYMRGIIEKKGVKRQNIFLNADIPERYGYKIISEDKRTRQRDVILRICYAADFTLAETQRALRIYGMPELYSKIPRDALLMIIFNERPGTILEVNSILKHHNMEVLRSSGIQD